MANCTTVAMENNTATEIAIQVKSVNFSYTPVNPVLTDISLNVPKGHIYTLLGSNGCGKTTLLNILLGRIKPHDGTVTILGHQITSTSSSPINHIIGYMPQEIALSPVMLIEDTFHYFALVNHIKDRQFVQSQIQNYLDMLGINDPKQSVSQLSGGQKRLLSLGVTLLYGPQILLLDEPTVGVDSIIRCKIWDHLNTICKLNGTTVLITTHYIDEAKQSNLVGFIKEGRMLAEESPQVLMSRLDCKTLEDVFYKLCVWKNRNNLANMESMFQFNSSHPQQPTASYPALPVNGIGDGHVSPASNDPNNNDANWANLNNQSKQDLSVPESVAKFKRMSEVMQYKQKICSHSMLNLDHLGALMCREMTIIKANYVIFLISVLLPVFSVWLFYSSYGRIPNNLPVAIFNEDTHPCPDHPDNCKFLKGNQTLSQIYLNAFNTSIVKMNFYPSEEIAYETVKAGRNIMALAFRKQYSKSFLTRYAPDNFGSSSVNDEYEYEDEDNSSDLGDSSIHVYSDVSPLLNTRFLNRSMFFALQSMIHTFGDMNGINPQIFSVPIQIKEFHHGGIEPMLQDMFLAGIIIIILLTLNILYSTLKIIDLRANGCLERDLNQGVKPVELILTFQVAMVGLAFIQVFVTMIFSFYIIDVRLDGNFWHAFILVFLTTIQGIFIGTLISIFCRSQNSALVSCFSVVVVMFFTAGILWPVEGMSPTLQKVFSFNPITIPIRSMRSIMLRGWPATNPQVLSGYISCIINSSIMFVLEILLFHYECSTKYSRNKLFNAMFK